MSDPSLIQIPEAGVSHPRVGRNACALLKAHVISTLWVLSFGPLANQFSDNTSYLLPVFHQPERNVVMAIIISGVDI
jgi:hypothetical protein